MKSVHNVQMKYRRLQNRNSASSRALLATVDTTMLVSKVMLMALTIALAAFLLHSSYRIATGTSFSLVNRVSPVTQTVRSSGEHGALTRVSYSGSSKSVTAITNKGDSSNLVERQIAMPVDQLPHGADWIMSLPAGGYTIQLHSSRSQDELNQLAKQTSTEQPMMLYPFKLDDSQPVYGLSLGIFSSYQKAITYYQALPAAQRQREPWVRSIDDLQRLVPRLM